MKKLLLLIIVPFTIIKLPAQSLVTDNHYTYQLLLDSVLSEDGYMCNVRQISITQKADGKLFQTLAPDENYLSCEWTRRDFFIVEDMNFDGHNDIRMIQSVSPGGNEMFFYWLFNPQAKEFVRDSMYEELLATAAFDNEKKTIASYWSGGTEYGIDTYQLVDGKLTLIEQEMTQPDESKTTYYVRTVRRLVNGTMQVIKTERISEAQFQKRQQ